MFYKKEVLKSCLLKLIFICLSASMVFAYSGGTGQPNNPYQIATKTDLLSLAVSKADYSKCFILTADINMAGQVFTAAIIAPDGGPIFSGTFDGNGYKISNAVINGKSSVGLFGGFSSGSIKNLHLDNFTVSGISSGYYAGCLVGSSSGGTISNCSSIGSVSGGNAVGGLVGSSLANCTISSCYAAGSVSGVSYVGGLAGEDAGITSNCFSTGSVRGTSYVGGLIGHGGGAISNCNATGSVSGTYYSGGLMGADSGTITNCYATGSVSGSIEVGGLVGDNGGYINNCYSIGDVNGGDNSYDLGGLVGCSGSDISNCFSTGSITGGNNSSNLGGLVGLNLYCNLSNCYSTGAVSGSTNVGGLVGINCYANISSSYFLISSGPNNLCGTPLTDAQMKQQSSFLGWDFTTPVWKICDGTNYPKLAWQKSLAGDFGCPNGVDIFDLAVFSDQWLLEKLSFDINHDGIVTFLDFAVFANSWHGDMKQLSQFASQWLRRSAYNADIAPSPGGDGIVNFKDFALFAEYWLKQN